MAVLVVGLGLFAVAFALHAVIWNIRVPRQQIGGLLLIYLFVGACGCIGFWAAPIGFDWLVLPPLRLLLALLLYGATCGMYLILFSAIEADSPTLTMLGIIRQAGADGIQRHELLRLMAEHSFVHSRLEQMINDGMLISQNGGLSVGPAGHLLAQLVRSYRTFLGRWVWQSTWRCSSRRADPAKLACCHLLLPVLPLAFLPSWRSAYLCSGGCTHRLLRVQMAGLRDPSSCASTMIATCWTCAFSDCSRKSKLA
jgi:hypothetical protein